MNSDFEEIKKILLQIKDEYVKGSCKSRTNPDIAITERDIVSEIYYKLRLLFSNKDLSSHTEIKPVTDKHKNISEKKQFRIDNVILQNTEKNSWILEATNIQDQYLKGEIEARFSSIPIKYFHTAIEVKIQSSIRDAIKDIEKLKTIQNYNKNCNCVFMLLNARGKIEDHKAILEYANKNNIFIIEHTCNNKIDKVVKEQMNRRKKIIELLNSNYSDKEVLEILKSKYPTGTFKTSNKQALYGTKRDMKL